MSDSGFTAFIDESGDEGFVFREPPGRGSSQWFVLSAIVVRNRNILQEMESLKNHIKTIYKDHWSKIHFRAIKHEQRCSLSNYLSSRPFRVISVCWDKKALISDGKSHTLDRRSHLHHYSIRYIMERLSWLSHFNAEASDPQPLVPIFSKCKNLKYDELRVYLRSLCTKETNIRWNSLDIEKMKVLPSSERLGLKAADAVATGIARGLELNSHQLCESTHCRHFKRITYNHNGRYINYGLKIMPAIPAIEQDHDERYRWIEEYR